MKRPNILWLMTDEQRCDSLGCYGSPWARTPHVDRLANEGCVFDSAITPAPVCLPARTSLLSSQYPAQTGVWYNDPECSSTAPYLLTSFREAGYQTASFGKQHYAEPTEGGAAFATEAGPCLSDHVGYFNYAAGYDESPYGVLKYPGDIYPWIFGGRFPSSAEECAESRVISQAMQWLDTRDPTSPFFLRVSFNGPHTPVTPPAPFGELIPAASITLPAAAESMPPVSPDWLTKELAGCASSDPMTASDIQRMRQCYYGEVVWLDSLFGRLLDWMRERGLLENCIVAYVSDHGTHLGDYGLVQKQTFFEPVVNVPFILSAPGRIKAGARYQTPVGIHSLLPTLMDLAGIEGGAMQCEPSLAGPLRRGHEPTARPIFSELTLQSFAPYIQHRGRLVMVRNGDWKLSACVDPEVHDVVLYDLASDPHERCNRAADTACRDRRETLLNLIAEHLAGA